MPDTHAGLEQPALYNPLSSVCGMPSTVSSQLSSHLSLTSSRECYKTSLADVRRQKFPLLPEMPVLANGSMHGNGASAPSPVHCELGHLAKLPTGCHPWNGFSGQKRSSHRLHKHSLPLKCWKLFWAWVSPHKCTETDGAAMTSWHVNLPPLWCRLWWFLDDTWDYYAVKPQVHSHPISNPEISVHCQQCLEKAFLHEWCKSWKEFACPIPRITQWIIGLSQLIPCSMMIQ